MYKPKKNYFKNIQTFTDLIEDKILQIQEATMKLNKRTNKTISKSITEVVENSVLQAKSQDQPEIKWTFVWYRGRRIKNSSNCLVKHHASQKMMERKRKRST